MTDLSPQAQAVLDAVCANTEPDCDTQHIIAAALEAAADQVVPEERQPDVPDFPDSDQIAPYYKWLCRRHIRAELLAIAAELRGQEAPAQPEPKGPIAWMYLGEPDYDGREWHDRWEVTLDEKLARFKSGNKDPVPLWRM